MRINSIKKRGEKMNRVKKMTAFALINLSVFTFSSFPALATDTVADINNGVRVISYEFNDIMLTSESNQHNIAILEEGISEIQCSVNVAGEELTIGYRDEEQGVSYEELLTQLKNEVDFVNETLLNEEKLEVNKSISLDDLVVKKVETIVPAKEMKNSYSLQGSYTQESIIMNLDDPYENVSYPTVDNVPMPLLAVDSSYHIKDGNIYWYNSLNGTKTKCASNGTNPHLGDGNNRRACGYNWYPNDIEAKFDSNVSSGKNRSTLYHEFSSANLNNLNVDSNEALEMTLMFYNEKNSSQYPGNAYQKTTHRTYTTNLPNAYLDTSFGDSSNIIQQCVGCAATEDLVANRTYFWSITSDAGSNQGNTYDGAFRVVAQRSYDSLGALTTPYRIFAEEHENQLKFGLNAGERWYSGNESAWKLSEQGKKWTFSNGTVTNEGA